MTTKNIDIFDADIDVLIHGCNCFHTMGAGLAKEVTRRYPQAEQADRETARGLKSKLGTISYAECQRPNGEFIWIVNAYTQFRYGRDRKHTDYQAVEAAFELVASKFNGLRIGIPYLIGCGLGGGDWAVMTQIINRVFYNQNVTICRKEE